MITVPSTDAAPVSYMEIPGNSVRERLLNALRIDLLGPETPSETLHQSPATRYLVGMLAPQGTAPSPSEDEDSEIADGEVDGAIEPTEGRHNLSQSLAPSSIGLSFIVGSDVEQVEVTASWGEYERVERVGEDAVVPTESSDIDPDGDPEESAKSKHKQYDWVRRPFEVSRQVPVARSGHLELAEGARMEWVTEHIVARRVVSVFLVNVRDAPPGRRPPDEAWMYQPKLHVGGQGPLFEPRRLPRESPDSDPDIASADLIYRDSREFAVGHGVAAEWRTESSDAERATEVLSNVIPTREVFRATGPTGIPSLSMDVLANVASTDEVATVVEPLLDAYEAWIDKQEGEAATVPSPDDTVAIEHVQEQRRSLERMRAGLRAISENEDALLSFRFANRAMAMQRRASIRVLRKRRGQPPLDDSAIPAEWRPFQMGFMLQAITGLVYPNHDDREIADLLWYPTGGGKTEAYLGLTAFVFALRRRWGNRDGYDFGRGTAVMMRYTLRLLTIQQFQRALALTCACEIIRRDDPDQWGVEPFTIGLWVGQSVTPNQYSDSKSALDDLRGGRTVWRSSPFQLLFCPWCGDDLEPRNYEADDELERTLIRCLAPDCAFGARQSELGLPALVVDAEIYRHPPSLLLATVDKFAQMAWNGRVKALFGRVDRECPRHGLLGAEEDHAKSHRASAGRQAAQVRDLERPLAPPDLIIQDELHLISGPLGSLVGIYESVVDGLATRRHEGFTTRPKIVASTATVRRAMSQIRALFDRDADIFPSLGLDARDSFFAVENRDESGRLYVGVFGAGKSIKTTLVRTYSALLSRAQFEFSQAVEGDSQETEADAYMTLVGYFNSLRELGGALRLLDDDVPARLRVLRNRGFGPNRILYEKDRELTSRRSSREITDTLKALDRTFSTIESGAYPIDVLLASNMISVGVDIDRLGLMVVSAQPKTSAEYIQATSRVGREHPGLVVEVYNWVRPRDISHYERFVHYHETFYRHVEATSVTPFSERARDRALPGVLTSYVRQGVPGLAAPEGAADRFDPDDPTVAAITKELAARAGRVAERDGVESETEAQLQALVDEWSAAVRAEPELVYSSRGSSKQLDQHAVLLRRMELEHGLGAWPVASSLREVENQVDVVLLAEEEA